MELAPVSPELLIRRKAPVPLSAMTAEMSTKRLVLPKLAWWMKRSEAVSKTPAVMVPLEIVQVMLSVS